MTTDNARAQLKLNINTNGLFTRCIGGRCYTTWTGQQLIVDGQTTLEGPNAPQIAVNSANGNVYIFWLSSAGELKMKRYVLQTQSWSGAIVVTTGINLIGLNNLPRTIDYMTAIVVPTIRYNNVTGRIIAVWHSLKVPQTPAPNDDTAIYYLSFDPDSIAGSLPAQLLIDATGPQLQPSIDNDPSGNALITYYSTQNAYTAGQYYQPFAACLNAAGSLTCTGSPVAGTSSSYRTTDLGDYHETYYWSYTDGYGPRWHMPWAQNYPGVSCNPTDESLTALK